MLVPDLVYANAPCHRPLIRMLIQYDGTMCHCCEDIHNSFHLGNVQQKSLEELWFSERHQRIIEDLIPGARTSISFSHLSHVSDGSGLPREKDRRFPPPL